MDKFVIKGGKKLNGTVSLCGAKNATLALMPATLLASGKYELQNTPEVLDCWLVSGNFDFLVRIGCRDMNQYRELAERWLGSSSFKISRILTTTELQAIKRQQALPPVPGAAGSDGCCV